MSNLIYFPSNLGTIMIHSIIIIFLNISKYIYLKFVIARINCFLSCTYLSKEKIQQIYKIILYILNSSILKICHAFYVLTNKTCIFRLFDMSLSSIFLLMQNLFKCFNTGFNKSLFVSIQNSFYAL